MSQTDEDVLDDLHIKLYEACKTMQCVFQLRNVLPVGTRSFFIWDGKGKRVRVLLSVEQVPTGSAEIALTRASLNLSNEQIAKIITDAFAKQQ